MPLQFKEIVDQIYRILDLHKYAFFAYMGVSATFLVGFTTFIWRWLKNFQLETIGKIDKAFEIMHHDLDRIASQLGDHETRIRENEENSIKHEEQIKAVVKICEERHDK